VARETQYEGRVKRESRERVLTTRMFEMRVRSEVKNRSGAERGGKEEEKSEERGCSQEYPRSIRVRLRDLQRSKKTAKPR